MKLVVSLLSTSCEMLLRSIERYIWAKQATVIMYIGMSIPKAEKRGVFYINKGIGQKLSTGSYTSLTNTLHIHVRIRNYCNLYIIYKRLPMYLRPNGDMKSTIWGVSSNQEPIRAALPE